MEGKQSATNETVKTKVRTDTYSETPGPPGVIIMQKLEPRKR